MGVESTTSNASRGISTSDAKRGWTGETQDLRAQFHPSTSMRQNVLRYLHMRALIVLHCFCIYADIAK